MAIRLWLPFLITMLPRWKIFKLEDKVALFFGTEKEGLSPEGFGAG